MQQRAAALRRAVTARPLAADALFAATLVLVGWLSARVAVDLNELARIDYEPPSEPHLVLGVAATAGPLALRRRSSLGAVGAVAAGFLLARVVLDVPEASVTTLVLAVAMYSAAAHGGRRRHLVNALVLAAIMARLWSELSKGLPPIDNALLGRALVLSVNLVLFLGAWALGATTRRRRLDADVLRERARQLEEERESNARRAVFEERVRIARELHDVVAHHVSVMGIHAAAARRVLATQPGQAASSLSSIETSSREAVTELQRLLGFLRQDGDVNVRAPQPRLADLGVLVEAGGNLAVAVHVEGRERPLPASLELSAYRLVQEALTNVRKHSGATRADVWVRYAPSSLEVEVVDDGRGAVVTPGGQGGHGLIGMRERVQLHGGHLSTGPGTGGGFFVRAVLPVEAVV